MFVLRELRIHISNICHFYGEYRPFNNFCHRYHPQVAGDTTYPFCPCKNLILTTDDLDDELIEYNQR